MPHRIIGSRNLDGTIKEVVKDEDWLFDKVMPVTESGCWIWMGYQHPVNGYGMYRTRGENGRNWSAHRFVFKLINGFLPKVVMHTCDNRCCVNPDHLKAGSQRDNLRDMVNKGRHGSKNWKKVLTDKEREGIMKSTNTQKFIAKEYGVDPSTISRIKNNKQ